MPATASLLTTKLYVPGARRDLVYRSRLLVRLAEGLTCPLTLISAPAGFGKTTLISAWHASEASQKFPLAWLSLDDDDNDPVRFLTYLIAALATLKPDFGETALALLKSPQPPPFKLILTNLINEVNQFPAPFALILDDYHLISIQAIHEALAFLLEHLPPLMRVVIITRADPPLPLARWRARRQLTEIRGDDLRFTSAEATTFLNQIMALNLSTADIAVLETHTEGWVAGLQMLALSMQGRTDISHFINSFSGSHRYIIDYLMDEVLHQQSEAIQQFLLQTSILNHLSGPLCDAVLGKDEANSSSFILEELERINLFLLPLDNERRWYRYHPLFAEALRTRLQHLYPERVAILHQRASLWHQQQGLDAEAIQHALSIPDFERAAYLIEQAGQNLLKRSEMATLLKWLKTLPEAVILARPQLCIFHAWSLMLNSHVSEAEQRLREASEHTDEPAILGQVAAIRAFIAVLRGEVRQADELTRQALAQLPADELFLRGMMALNLAVPYFLSGDIEAAAQTFAEAGAISQKSGNIMVAVAAKCQLAEVQILQGQLQRAFALHQQALALVTNPDGQELPGAGQVHIGLGAILYEWNDLAGASEQTALGFHLGQQWGEMAAFDGYIVLMNLKQAQGDHAGALEAVGLAEQLGQKFSPLINRLLEPYQARLWLAQGNLAAAGRWAAALQGLNQATSPDPFHYHLHEFEQLSLARILIAQASAQSSEGSGTQAGADSAPLQKALQLLQVLHPTALKLGRGRSVIEILLLQALAHQTGGDIAKAVTLLTQALTLAEPEGFVRLFVDEGVPMATLLRRLNPHNRTGAGAEAGTQSMNGYVQKLLAAFTPNNPPPLHPSTFNLQPLIEPLSERELEILYLIAAGKSNEEIGQALVIALGTVKKHINNIYGKLGVHSRTQALVRAKALNLLL